MTSGHVLLAQVAYFVNSGSEANDLALRIAHCAAPGADHVAIMAGAYHGHTKAIIDLSPYKYDGPGGEGQQPHIHVLPCPDPYRWAPVHVPGNILLFGFLAFSQGCQELPHQHQGSTSSNPC